MWTGLLLIIVGSLFCKGMISGEASFFAVRRPAFRRILTIVGDLVGIALVVFGAMLMFRSITGSN